MNIYSQSCIIKKETSPILMKILKVKLLFDLIRYDYPEEVFYKSEKGSDKVEVAGLSGRNVVSKANPEKPEYAVEFIGYFPADESKYSIIVSMNKIGFPASGGLMAGSVFSEIVDCIVTE